jgi:transposase InsO family protein
LTGKRYVLMDRDSNFGSAFRSALEEEGVVPVRLLPRSLDLNPHIERFHLSMKSEYLSKMIFFSEKMLRNAVRQYLEHHHTARNCQSLGNRIIDPGEEVGRSEGEIVCDERFGGILRYYHHVA